MLARVLKDKINEQMRLTMKLYKIPVDEPYREVVVNFLNQIFVTQREDFWTKDVKQLVINKFLFGLTDEELSVQHNLLSQTNIPNLISRLGDLTEIIIKPDSIPVLEYGSSLIVDSDLLDMRAKIKGMNIIYEATAMLLQHEAEQRSGTEANRLYQLAIDHFKQAISASPNNRFAFYEFGKMLHKMALQNLQSDESIVLLTHAIDRLTKCFMIPLLC